jgi:hypothetical protein
MFSLLFLETRPTQMLETVEDVVLRILEMASGAKYRRQTKSLSVFVASVIGTQNFIRQK